MSFHDVRFPARLSFGSSGGPMRQTDIVSFANGFEERNTLWKHSLRRYDAGLGLRSLDDVFEIFEFFEARSGRLHGFRWKDWLDYKSCRPSGSVSCVDQLIGWGDGETSVFQPTKAYASGQTVYRRPISKIVSETFRLAVDEKELPFTDYDINAEDGMIHLKNAPINGVKVTAGYEFDVPTRFDTDSITCSASSFQAGDLPNIPIIELRV